MRITALFLFGFLVCFVGPAQADPKFLGLFWTKPKDFSGPYLDNGRHAHPSQWDQSKWVVGDWVANSNEGLARIQRFYDADVLTGQYKNLRGIPVLEVGSGFYHLSGQDQRRVLSLVDTVYNITDGPHGVFQVRDYKTNNVVGVYSKAGFANE